MIDWLLQIMYCILGNKNHNAIGISTTKSGCSTLQIFYENVASCTLLMSNPPCTEEWCTLLLVL